MNMNSSKHHKVMTEENHQNKSDEKQRKLEERDQALLSNNEDSEHHDFPEFCKQTSLKIFDHKYLQEFNDFTKSGRILYFIR